jgi:hypothetical protein
MARELPRTIYSLSPPYQRDVCAGDLEIIVIDNGSQHRPVPTDFDGIAATVIVESCTVRSPSPVAAANQGLLLARGKLIGMWLDGARMASPGLLAACIAAARLSDKAVVATVNYQLGPARQCVSGDHGYNRTEEDRLLDSIEWPKDGYRLFDVATCELADPETSPMLESNGLFMPATLWDLVGGYDSSFDMPGGGMANPDLLTRATDLPGAEFIRVVGEGTFHQTHGGVTTTSLTAALNELKIGSQFYRQLRGKPLAPVRKRGTVYDARNKMQNAVK